MSSIEKSPELLNHTVLDPTVPTSKSWLMRCTIPLLQNCSKMSLDNTISGIKSVIFRFDDGEEDDKLTDNEKEALNRALDFLCDIKSWAEIHNLTTNDS